jgi:16S rRNA (cytidine1402-2'-O)-methyltransferase
LLAANGWSGHALVGFESPHRVLASLRDLEAVLGDRRIAICRELSKLHEEVFRGSAGAAIEYFSTPKGEFTLVIEGAVPQKAGQTDAPGLGIFLRERRAAGGSARDAVAAAVARFGVSRRSAYAAWEAVKTE